MNCSTPPSAGRIGAFVASALIAYHRPRNFQRYSAVNPAPSAEMTCRMGTLTYFSSYEKRATAVIALRGTISFTNTTPAALLRLLFGARKNADSLRRNSRERESPAFRTG